MTSAKLNIAGYLSQNLDAQEKLQWGSVIENRWNIIDYVNTVISEVKGIPNLRTQANLTQSGLYFNLMNTATSVQVAHVSFHYGGGNPGMNGTFHLIDDINKGVVRFVYSFSHNDFFVADRAGQIDPGVLEFGKLVFEAVRNILLSYPRGGKRTKRYRQTRKQKAKKRQTRKH